MIVDILAEQRKALVNQQQKKSKQLPSQPAAETKPFALKKQMIKWT